MENIYPGAFIYMIKIWEGNSMLCCCKECKYNCSCDKRCSFLKAQLKYIKCCPMMIQNELLNDAEKYMKDNDLKLFMKYIIEQTGNK